LLNKFPDEKTVERYVTSSLFFLPPHSAPSLPRYHCIWSVDYSS
jgi:hypothetical protein